MKKSIFALAIFLCFSHVIFGQTSHLSLIYDFDGQDFDHSVAGMVGTNDSLYVIANTPDGQGVFFRIDENGEGYKVIWEFDNVNYAPFSIISNDEAIYGTTRFSANGGGTLFKYSLQDHSFEFVKDFDWHEAQEIQIKYITDGVLWLNSQSSAVDEGSIFMINPNGTAFKKIYQATSAEQAQNPVDFVFHENKVYIACVGGGNLYPNGDGTFTYSGSFIRINKDGTGYENIIPGGDAVGTQPQSLIIKGNKLFGQFAYSGSHGWFAQFFRSNLDGTEYDSLGALPERALTRMQLTDRLIYGFSSSKIIGINPFTGKIRICDQLLSNPDFGSDVAVSPGYLNGDVFIAAQQGGPNGGGTILKWINEDPEINESYFNLRIGRMQDSKDIDLNELFKDPEEDLLMFSWKYEEESVTVTESNGVLTLTSLVATSVDVEITAADGWAGSETVTLRLNPDGTVIVITGIDEEVPSFFLYPNPVHSVLNLNRSNVKSIDILSLDGKICASFSNPGESVDTSTLRNGIYYVRAYVNGNVWVQKIIKD